MTAQNPLGALRALATNETWFDAAIDMSEPGPVPDDTPPDQAPLGADARVTRYRETRERDALILLPHVKPTEFVLEPIPAMYLAEHIDTLPFTAALTAAFIASCRMVVLPAGDPLRPQTPVRPRAYGAMIPEDPKAWVECIRKRFGMPTLYEMGSVALQWAKLPDGAKGPFSCAVGQGPRRT
jgi:hypothetical protein